MRSRWMRVAAWFAATRLIIFAVGVIGAGSFVNLRTQTVLDSTSALRPDNVWLKWDALWYQKIAEQGYGPHLDPEHPQVAAAYFPLYPMTVRAAMTVLPSFSFFSIATALSNLLTLGALLLLAYGLIDEADRLQRVVALTLTAAGSFYLSIPYSESLFLFLVAAVLVATRRGQYELGGLLAGLSATTRVHGLALVAVPACACWLDGSLGGRRWPRAAATVAAFAAPFIVYMAYLGSVYGSWFAFVDSQGLWDNTAPYPFAALAGFARFPTRLTVWLHGGFWLLYAGLLARYWKRMPLGESLFCLGVFLISTQQEQFHGTYRYMVPLIPLTMAIADDDRNVRTSLMAFNIAFGVLMILAFVTWNRLTV